MGKSRKELESQLLPCPFCGNTKIIIEGESPVTGFTVVCDGGCGVNMYLGRHREDAGEEWNARTPDPSRLLADLAVARDEADRLRAACRRGDGLFARYAAIVRDIGFPVVARDFDAYAAEFRAALDATPATGQSMPAHLSMVAAIMREEGAEIASAEGDADYWLSRAAEHMRRYAGWIEAVVAGETTGIFPPPGDTPALHVVE